MAQSVDTRTPSGFSRLLTRPEQNPKTNKGLAFGYMTFPLHLAPAKLSGFEVCPKRSAGCTAACLNTAGRGRFAATQSARIARAQWFFNDRAAFMARLVQEVRQAIAYANKRGYRAAFRLNATSDIPWHRVPVAGAANIMELFPQAQFYDYTKVGKRLAEQLPANYQLTFSLNESNAAEAKSVLAAGGNVAVVFRNRALVESLLGQAWLGAIVADGDKSDLRFLDPKGAVIALYAKGPAKADRSGFVHDN